MTRSVFPHWGGLARPFRALRFVIARYIRTRPKVSVTSLELGAIVIVLLWIGVVAKHLGDRSADFLSTRSSMNNFALFFEESVLRSIGEIDKALLYLRKSIVARNGSGDYARLVDSTDLLSDVIVQVAIFDEAGSLLASSGDHRPTYSIGLNDQEYFRYRVNGSDDELFIGRPSIERGSGRLTVPFARQFRKADGGLGGVVVASFDPMHFESLFSGMDLGVGATYLLVGDDGVVRGAGGAKREGYGVGMSLPVAVLSANSKGTASAGGWDEGAGKGACDLVVVRKVGGYPFSVIARTPEATVYQNSMSRLSTMLAIGAIVSLAVVLAARRGYRFETQVKQKAELIRRSHAALRESHARLVRLNVDLSESKENANRNFSLFHSVFECAPDGMVCTDTDYNVVSLNPALSSMLGYDDEGLRGQPLRSIFPTQTAFEQVVEHSVEKCPAPVAIQSRCVRKNGEIFPVQLNISHVQDPFRRESGFLAIIRDVSDDQKRETALRERQHLEALGRLTGRIAHDFNNLLTVISGNLQLIEMNPQAEKVSQYLREADHATVIGARINQRLMTFARQRRLDAEMIDLDGLIRGMLDLIRRSVGEEIFVTAYLSSSPSVVRIDVSEMENALLNLALNAKDAMHSGGCLVIETSNIDLDLSESGCGEVVPAGQYVRLDVMDTGDGMSQEVAARAFEPFFTTKSEDNRFGLGLATVHGYVKQSGGYATINSEPGRGTTIRIYLPRHVGPPHRHAGPPISCATPASQQAETVAAAGSGRIILVVEDNAAVRTVTSERLTALGYRVVEAASGAEALEVVAKGTPIELVMSDVVMPGGVSGFELARRLSQTRPGLPVLLTSGYSHDGVRDDVPDGERRTILWKPYSQEELARRIAQALAEASLPLTTH